MSINKSIARRWVARLRSGELQQGKGLLSYYGEDDTRRFCCLGVLCELAVEDRVIKPGERNWNGTVIYDDMSGMPSIAIRDYIGVDDWHVTVPAENLDGSGEWHKADEATVSVALDTLNDNADWTFEQIADAIERHYELADD